MLELSSSKVVRARFLLPCVNQIPLAGSGPVFCVRGNARRNLRQVSDHKTQALSLFREVDMSIISIYGNTAIEKGYCPDCGAESFIRDGQFLCCGGRANTNPTRYKRESEPDQHRVRLAAIVKARILEDQGHRCFYCDQPFGAVHHRRAKVSRHRMRVVGGSELRGTKITLRVCFDHRLPYAYSQDNRESNFVAACQVCNTIKGALVFGNMDEARVYIADHRRAKGYDF